MGHNKLMSGDQPRDTWASEEEFLLHIEKELQRLQGLTASTNWVNTGDWDKVVRAVHNLRGTAAMVGHPMASRIFEGLESKLSRAEEFTDSQLREEVNTALGRAAELLRGFAPVSAASPPEPPAERPHEVLTPATLKRLKPLNILVIDNDAAFRSRLRTAYQRLGMTLSEMDRGAELQPECLAANKIDVVILDLKLPDEDGYSICKRLKAHAASSQVPIVFVSASGDPEPRLFGWQVGAEDFIVKPVDPLGLLFRIEFLVQRAAARRLQQRQVGVSYDAFVKELEKRILEAIAGKEPLVLATLAVTGGGSEEKQRAAGVKFLLDHLRRGDVLCTPTAGYLMVSQPDTSLATARKKFETLSRRLKRDFAMDCRVGLAQSPTHGRSPQDLLAASKECLDRARQAGASATVVTPRSHKDDAEKPFKLVVIDDDEAFLDYLGKHFAELGLNAVLVLDSDRAVEAVRQHRPDLVTLDILMPEPDGLKILQTLKADPELSTIPVIMVSAKGEEESLHQAFSLGAADYLIKPFRPAELNARVRKVLREHVSTD